MRKQSQMLETEASENKKKMKLKLDIISEVEKLYSSEFYIKDRYSLKKKLKERKI